MRVSDFGGVRQKGIQSERGGWTPARLARRLLRNIAHAMAAITVGGMTKNQNPPEKSQGPMQRELSKTSSLLRFHTARAVVRIARPSQKRLQPMLATVRVYPIRVGSTISRNLRTA